MSANEFSERIRLAVAAGDVAEVERLVGSDWGVNWTARRARDVLADITKGKPVTPGQALHHCLLIALETGNQLAVAKAECSGLRRRIEELEQRPANTQTNGYRGVWKESETYRAGEICTHAGTIWFCHLSTHEKPGTSDAWQLMVKNK